MSRGSDKQHGKSERRNHDDRRLDGERRQTDAGAPERREGEPDRRHLDKGPPERRHNHDRRDVEQGPPAGWKDRRRIPERRAPEVAEISFEQWARKRAAQGPGASEARKPGKVEEETEPPADPVTSK